MSKHLTRKLLSILSYAYRPPRSKIRSNNISAMASALYISRPKMRQLLDEGDDWPWWPIILIEAITRRIPHLDQSDRRFVLGELKDLPDEYTDKVARWNEAEIWLREQLQGDAVLVSELMRPHNRLTISEQRIKRAAKKLGVIKERTGRREDMQVTWRLPTLEDWYQEHAGVNESLLLPDHRQPSAINSTTKTKRRPKR